MCEICQRQEIEKAYKALRLNGFEPSYYYDHGHKLSGASSLETPIPKEKPTVYIKRLKFGGHNPNSIHLKGASFIQQRFKLERENAEKALRLNGAL